jgi:hypothetical protein
MKLTPRLLCTSVVASSSLACATAGGPRQLDPPQDASSWSRVRELAAAAAITVQARSVPPGQRLFVLADESVVVTLNLTDAALPAVATRTLREMAARDPERLAALGNAGTLVQNDVRIGRDGLFVSGRQVASLDQILIRTPRNEVTEIRGPVVARGSVLGTVVGGWLGFSIGAVPALGGAEEGVALLALVGSTVFGGYLGHRWSSHLTEGVVYRAP